MVAQLQQHGDCKLTHGSSSVRRHIGKGDPFFPCIYIVHHIIAGGQHGDVFYARACIHDILCDRCLVGDDHLSISDTGNDLILIRYAGPVINRKLT